MTDAREKHIAERRKFFLEQGEKAMKWMKVVSFFTERMNEEVNMADLTRFMLDELDLQKEVIDLHRELKNPTKEGIFYLFKVSED